jgi:septum formation topological specificity factor MinE
MGIKCGRNRLGIVVVTIRSISLQIDELVNLKDTNGRRILQMLHKYVNQKL